MAKTCSDGSNYFALVDECVPLSIASTSTFLTAYKTIHKCQGGIVDSISKLENLRFCQSVIGGLTITLNEASADFSALFDVAHITGMMSSVDSIVQKVILVWQVLWLLPTAA